MTTTPLELVLRWLSNAHQSESSMTRVPENICVACGAPNDGAMAPQHNAKPNAGDVSMCMYCGHLAIFRADLSVREATAAELAAIGNDQIIIRMLQLRRECFGDEGYPLRRKS
jgi:hypothetical protein